MWRKIPSTLVATQKVKSSVRVVSKVFNMKRTMMFEPTSLWSIRSGLKTTLTNSPDN